MQALFDAIRAACSPGVWSRGVELARSEAVTGERASPAEWLLRVSTRGGLISPGVTLYPEDEDWECECRGQEDPCEHVAAAVIAARRAHQSGAELPRAGASAGRLRYRLRREDGGLHFEREIVTGDRATPLTSTLEAISSGRVEGPRFAATPVDLSVEVALGSHRSGRLPRGLLRRVLELLAGSGEVLLDGAPVSVSAEPLVPRARVVDARDGVRVQVELLPGVGERFSEDVALCGDTLRPIADSRLSGRELEELPRGRLYRADELAELATELLPSLRERIDVEIATQRLPATTEREPPRLRLELSDEQGQLCVLPTLVYGDPPRARIDAGRLVPLGGPVPIRDEAAERARVRQLQSELGLALGHRVRLDAEAAIELRERITRFPGEIQGDAHERFYRAGALAPRLELGDGRTGFALSFELPAGAAGEPGSGSPERARGATAAQVLGAWRAGDSMVRLSGGGFGELPSDWLERFGPRIADLLAARGEDESLPASALPDLARLCDDLEQPRPPALERLAPLLEGVEGVPKSPLPRDLAATLRGYQRQGVDWLAFLAKHELGALLADDMGLGKTLQALCVLRARSLVVAPTSVLHSWEHELRRFRPALRFQLYHGARRRLDPEAALTLTSYAILRQESEKLAAIDWQGVVLDEAQAIKNPDSQVARAAYRLRAHFRIALTGTPIENRLEELWSQLHFLNPGLLGGRSDFRDRYARPIAAGDPDAIARLRERIRPFVLRRMKSQVAPELPKRTEVVLKVELEAPEREVYESVRAARVPEVVAKLRAGGSPLLALEALLRLRQAACHPALVPGQNAVRSSKLELLRERLEQAVADGHKALVFSQWTSLLDRVEPELAKVGIAFLRLDGSTPKRGRVVEAFQGEDGPPVMLVSLRAGGTGLNLTAADHVFLLDPWWNPAVEDQAADRAHRIGQTRPVVIHRLVSAETVEERILELQAKKRELGELALGDAARAGSLGRDEILALLE